MTLPLRPNHETNKRNITYKHPTHQIRKHNNIQNRKSENRKSKIWKSK